MPFINGGATQVILVPVEQVEEGMVLGRPVCHPLRPGVVLLQAGCRLDNRAIGLFPQYNIEHLWVRHPDFEDLDCRLSPGVQDLRAQIEAHLKALFSSAATQPGSIEPKNSIPHVVALIKELSTDTRHCPTVERVVDDADDLAGHCANVAYLATVIGLWLRGYIVSQRKGASPVAALDLTNLVLGAALHDIGKLALEKASRVPHHFQDAADAPAYRTHVEKGYRLLQGRMESTASASVLHHHQRFDGEGFPVTRSRQDPKQVCRLAGRALHVFPRIVAVANTLDGLFVAARQESRPLVSALASLLSPEFRPMFDPVVLLTAAQCVPPFPIATVVGLADGRLAVVVEHNADNPCRPKVRVFNDGFGPDKRTGDDIDLSKPGAPAIACQGVHRIDKFLYDLPPELIHAAAAPGDADLVAETA